jgi:hypothetical protein
MAGRPLVARRVQTGPCRILQRKKRPGLRRALQRKKRPGLRRALRRKKARRGPGLRLATVAGTVAVL